MNTIQQTLQIDPALEVEKIVTKMKETARRFRKQGAVLGISGGIDSSVCAALALKAFGRDRVLTLQMNESDSEDQTEDCAQLLVDAYNLQTIDENITSTLQATGCYQRRNEAIRTVVPEFQDDWKCKIVLPSLLQSNQLRFFSLVVQKPDGEIFKKRLSGKAYLQIVAASNFKQRVRKMLEYYHADRLNYLVIGTPNLLEYDQGFFVKGGDGAADIKPIAHLYKTQVYQLAEYLEVPQEIVSRPPTTDTYSMEQSQEEFYFSLPYDQMDLCLHAVNNGIEAKQIAQKLNLESEQIERIFKDIQQKRVTNSYLHASPQLI